MTHLWLSKREEATSGHLVRMYASFSLKGSVQTYVPTANGRLLRGQRMVAHNVADVSFVFAVMVRRRTFFQEGPSIVFLTVRLFVAPSDKVEVEPGFVVATLVSRADTKSFMGNGESAVLTNLPLSIRIRRFEESTNVSPLTWKCSRSPQWCGAGRHRQSAVSKGLFNSTDVVSVVASPCSPVEVTGHQVHFFVKHHCTNREDKLFSYAAFLRRKYY